MQNPYRRRPNPASPGPLTYGAAPPPTNPYAAAAQRPAVSVTVHAPAPTVPQQQPAADDPIARLLSDPNYQQLSPEIRGFLQSRTGQPVGQAPVPTQPLVAQPDGTVGHAAPQTSRVGMATVQTPAPAAPAAPPPPPAPVQLPPGFERAVDQSGAPAGQMTIVNPALGLTQNVPDPTYVAPVAAPQAQAPVAVAATMANPPPPAPAPPPPPAPTPAPLAPSGPPTVANTRMTVPDVARQAKTTPGFEDYLRANLGQIYAGPPPAGSLVDFLTGNGADVNGAGNVYRLWQQFNNERNQQATRQANPNYQLQQQQLAQQGWSTVGESAGDGSGFYVRPDWQPSTESDAARFTRGYVNYAAKAFGLPDEDRRQLLGMTDDALKNWLAGGFSKLIPKVGSGGYADPRTQDILRQYAGGAYKAKPPEVTPAPAPPPPAKSPEEQERDAVKADPEAVALAHSLGIDLDTASPVEIKRVREAAERGRANRNQPVGATVHTSQRR